jgi:hypothetical protein
LKRNVERQFAALLDGEFLRRAENVLVFGAPGGDKSSLHSQALRVNSRRELAYLESVCG